MLFCETSNPLFSGSTFSSSYGYLFAPYMFQLGFNTVVAPPVCILRAEIVKDSHDMSNCYVFYFIFFLKVYIFEVVAFYLSLR